MDGISHMVAFPLITTNKYWGILTCAYSVILPLPPSYTQLVYSTHILSFLCFFFRWLLLVQIYVYTFPPCPSLLCNPLNFYTQPKVLWHILRTYRLQCQTVNNRYCLWLEVKVKVTLRPTTSRSVSPGCKAHEGLTTWYLFLLTFTSIVLSITGAPSDERSGLSFVIVIVRPLLVNIYRFTCNVHVSDIYEYI
jgi:hypothetical protein